MLWRVVWLVVVGIVVILGVERVVAVVSLGSWVVVVVVVSRCVWDIFYRILLTSAQLFRHKVD